MERNIMFHRKTTSYNEEEANVYLMVNHQDDEVTSYFSYHNIFCICKKLTKETSKFEQIVSTSKDIISSLELKNKNLEKLQKYKLNLTSIMNAIL